MAKAHHHGMHAHVKKRETAPVQDGAILVAMLFVLVGVLGFLPGITTGFGGMEFAGTGSDAKLLGIFEVSILHNLVHLVFGLVGMFMSWFTGGARLFLLGGGTIYLVLGVYGFFIDKTDAANFLPMNTADDWLHVGLGVAMLVLGLVLRRTPADRSEGYPT
ncbi:DUF4383 domain-containing protein [Glycomyces sp. L485]|uniref:DUF4383 domain-containing protein n=1 Tax=Glycomyces sp. L485 TaxID=2909235 RepID=UPI001F4BC11B|nr:DUF4383 domain-containing protein [Glycomyces sp. L485]MCH7231916.1 DUF4383 domain-containing protein [Glycomyces sp. L485]